MEYIASALTIFNAFRLKNFLHVFRKLPAKVLLQIASKVLEVLISGIVNYLQKKIIIKKKKILEFACTQSRLVNECRGKDFVTPVFFRH